MPLGKNCKTEQELSGQLDRFFSRFLLFFEQSFSLGFAPFAACFLRLEFAQNV